MNHPIIGHFEASGELDTSRLKLHWMQSRVYLGQGFIESIPDEDCVSRCVSAIWTEDGRVAGFFSLCTDLGTANRLGSERFF